MFRSVKTLVTGCSGFLGPWLCQRLVAEGAEVVGGDIQFDRNSRIYELGKNEIKFVELDVQQFAAVENVVREHGIQLIFHLAAQSLVGEALTKPLLTTSTNVMGTANILEAARLSDVRGVVLASSDKAYGDQDDLPYFEDAPMMGRFPYDVSKSCADMLARSYWHTYRLPTAVLRCGNLYGGGDVNWSRIVPGTVRSCLAGKRPIVRSDGTLVRDYVYVEDATDAFLLVGNALLKGSTVNGAAFNVSREEPHTVLEVVDMIRNATNRNDLEPIIEATARGEIQAQYLSGSLMKTQFNWSPKTDLPEGLLRTVDWYRSR